MARRELTPQEWGSLANQAHYNARNLAQLYGRSMRQLQREFKRLFHQSPQAWLDERRIKAAGPLLLSGAPIKNVASDLGFKQTSHFYRKFKSQNGVTPSKFVSLKSQTGSDVAPE
jgi:AraC-like DNA-binding protein